MRKRKLALPSFVPEKADRRNRKSDDTTRSLARRVTLHQILLMCRRLEITDIIELLEDRGYYGETALFVLAYIQIFGEVA